MASWTEDNHFFWEKEPDILTQEGLGRFFGRLTGSFKKSNPFILTQMEKTARKEGKQRSSDRSRLSCFLGAAMSLLLTYLLLPIAMS